MKIAVIGTGYVGLVSGVCLAARGHDVTCLDLSRDVVRRINQGEPHIYERGLEALLQNVIAEKRFRAALVDPARLQDCRIIMLAVGTPSTEGRIDLSQVAAACQIIGSYLRNASTPCSVIVKSTVVPGTTDTAVRQWLEAASGRKLGEFGLGMNPEFLREGEAIADFMEADRIVLGCETESAWDALRELYAPWTCEKIRVNSRTAEMIKYANNSLLAAQISMANELANIAAAIGDIDVCEVMAGVHADKRWSPLLADGQRVRPGILAYLWPGCGFGGSCFPKDVQALRARALEVGLEPLLLSSILAVNQAQPHEITRILRQTLGSLRGRRVLVLGLAFKPDTDDLRESASRKVIEDLLREGAAVLAHDPMAMVNARKAWSDLSVEYVTRWQDHVDQVDVITVMTRWPDYLELVRVMPKGGSRDCVIFDARRLFKAADFPGYRYMGIGRRPLGASACPPSPNIPLKPANRLVPEAELAASSAA
jgi:UDPglucose 6-dehydrogenase/GDP-mannose 6-dehydrogenase